MIFRAILAGIFVFLASFVNASQYCEQILKEDFREESKSSHLFQDGGIVLHSETPVIYKVRDGSVASDLDIKPGDRIIRVNNKLLSNIETIAFNQISRILATPTKQDIILHIQNNEGIVKLYQINKQPFLGHPIVETDIKLKNIEIINQSRKTHFDLSIDFGWDNERQMYEFEKIFQTPDNQRKVEFNCTFRRSKELDNILGKLWYPTFDTKYPGSLIKDLNYESLLITNDKQKPYNFILKSSLTYIGKNETSFDKFPFDKITSKAEFEFLDSDLQTSKLYNPELTIKKFNKILYEWKITNHELVCCGPEKSLNKIEYIFELDRKSFYYSLKIITPVVALVLLSFLVFLIRPKELESKLAISMGSLLTLVAYNFVFVDDVPKLNYITVLDAWILLSYLFAGLSTAITVYSFYIYIRGKQTGSLNTLDNKKSGILISLSYILLMFFLYWGIMNDWSLYSTPISV